MNPDKKKSNFDSKEFMDIREKLGSFLYLSDHELLVYWHLLMNIELTATEVSKATGIRRSWTYELLRNLKEKGLIQEKNGTPKVFISISPRIVISNWIQTREREMQVESTAMLGVQQTLQNIWGKRNEVEIEKGLFLLSEYSVREVIPRETKVAKDSLCLALHSSDNAFSPSENWASPFIDHSNLTGSLMNFQRRKATLYILVENLNRFLSRSWDEWVNLLTLGIENGFIEVRETNRKIPHSFLIVDDRRVYMFFLDCTGRNHREAIRMAIPGLIDTMRSFWGAIWEQAKIVRKDQITCSSACGDSANANSEDSSS